MSTTAQNFILQNFPKAFLSGGSVQPAGTYAKTFDPSVCVDAVANGATPLDRVVFDLALLTTAPAAATVFATLGKFVGGFAKNGCGVMTLTTTTTIDIDLTDLTLAAAATITSAGDTAFSTVQCIILNNLAAKALTLKPGASNAASFPVFAGTSPTIKIESLGCMCFYSPTGIVVDSTHKLLTITPATGGLLAFAIGGA